jgi:hypothetical protein
VIGRKACPPSVSQLLESRGNLVRLFTLGDFERCAVGAKRALRGALLRRGRKPAVDLARAVAMGGAAAQAFYGTRSERHIMERGGQPDLKVLYPRHRDQGASFAVINLGCVIVFW